MGAPVLTIVTRASPLARAQSEEALAILTPMLLPGTRCEVIPLDTPGDRDKSTPLGDPAVPDDFFTRDLDQALLSGRADLAVHSAKDLPQRLPPGLRIACLLPARDSRDALVYRAGVGPGGRPPRRIGVSSPRRDAAVRALHPDAERIPLRGTIGERVALLDRGDYDLIIVAACALERLGLAARIGGWLPGATTPLQGHLALVTRAGEREWIERFRPLDFRMRLFEMKPQTGVPASAGAETDGGERTPALLHTGTRPERYTGRGPVVHWPMIQLEPAPRAERIAALAGELADCDSVLFASPFAARCFVDALFHGPGLEAMDGRRLLAVGPATAEDLERLGWRADAVAPGYGGLSGLLAGGACPPGRCFYPCSDAAPLAERAAQLRTAGIEPVPWVFYRTRARTPGSLPSHPFDRVLFASLSGVDAYFTAYPDERAAARTWLAVGASTLAALQKWGLRGECIHED